MGAKYSKVGDSSGRNSQILILPPELPTREQPVVCALPHAAIAAAQLPTLSGCKHACELVAHHDVHVPEEPSGHVRLHPPGQVPPEAWREVL